MDCRDVDTLVVGLPKNMNGTLGEQAEKVQDFAEKLKAACGRKLVYWDERLTTKSAHRTLLEADMSRKNERRSWTKLPPYIFCKVIWTAYKEENNERRRNELD